MIIVSIFLLGVATLNWYWTDQKRRKAEAELASAHRQNQRLVTQNQQLLSDLKAAYSAMTPEKAKPSPKYWGSRPYDRMMRHLEIIPSPDNPSQDRDAIHKHATKGPA